MARGVTTATVLHSSDGLRNFGATLKVVVSPSKSPMDRESCPIRSISVMGLLDTGANPTLIDVSIAEYLGLTMIGSNPIHTAAGIIESKHYSLNLNFVDSELRQFSNLKVSSSKLSSFDIEKALAADTMEKSIGVLIGRDIMANWNIVWHGPTSSVFISD